MTFLQELFPKMYKSFLFDSWLQVRQSSTNQLTKTTAFPTGTFPRIARSSSTLQKLSASSPVKDPVTSSSITEFIPTSDEGSKGTTYPPTKTGNFMYTLFCWRCFIRMTCTGAFISIALALRRRSRIAQTVMWFVKRSGENFFAVTWLSVRRTCDRPRVRHLLKLVRFRGLFFMTQNGKKTTPANI